MSQSNRKNFAHNLSGVRITDASGTTVGAEINGEVRPALDLVDRVGSARALALISRGLRSGALQKMEVPDRPVASPPPIDSPRVRPGNRAFNRYYGRAERTGIAPVVVYDGRIRVKDVMPGDVFTIPFDLGEHIRRGFCDQVVEDQDVESGGSTSLELAVPAGHAAQAAGFVLETTQESDEGVTINGQVTTTYQDVCRNAFNVQDAFVTDGAGATLFITTKVDETNSFKFSQPVGASKVMQLFSRRPSSGIPFCVPGLAMLVTPTATASAETQQKKVAITITSQNGGKLGSSARLLFPGSADFPDVMGDVRRFLGGT